MMVIASKLDLIDIARCVKQIHTWTIYCVIQTIDLDVFTFNPEDFTTLYVYV